MTNKFNIGFISLFFAVFLSSCSTIEVELPKDLAETNPPNQPVRNLTGFTEGLACMDRLFAEKGVDTIYVTALNIPDQSEGHGSAGVGAREMIISSISQMAQESGVLRYIAYDRTTPDIISLQAAHPDRGRFKVPDFFIRGAITQLDKSTWSKQHGAGMSIGDVIKALEGSGAHYSNSTTMSTVALDLNMGMTSTFQILPGITSSNMMSVVKKGKSAEISLSVEDIGAIFSANENRSKALSTALRSLVEVGMIEMFGKLYNVPYWNCVAPLGANSQEEKEAMDMYNSMEAVQKITYIAEGLKKQGFLSKDIEKPVLDDGTPSDELKNAIAHYKAVYDMSSNTLANANVFKKLYLQNKAPAGKEVMFEEIYPVKRWLHHHTAHK